MPWGDVERGSGRKEVIGLVKEYISQSTMGCVGDCGAYEEVSPSAVASFGVYFGKFKCVVCEKLVRDDGV